METPLLFHYWSPCNQTDIPGITAPLFVAIYEDLKIFFTPMHYLQSRKGNLVILVIVHFTVPSLNLGAGKSLVVKFQIIVRWYSIYSDM